jgi:hypothetical protein
MNQTARRTLVSLLGGATLALFGCGPAGVGEDTAALSNGYGHCIVVPSPSNQAGWVETGMCLTSSISKVCDQIVGPMCVKGRQVNSAPYNTCSIHEDLGLCN